MQPSLRKNGSPTISKCSHFPSVQLSFLRLLSTFPPYLSHSLVHSLSYSSPMVFQTSLPFCPFFPLMLCFCSRNLTAQVHFPNDLWILLPHVTCWFSTKKVTALAHYLKAYFQNLLKGGKKLVKKKPKNLDQKWGSTTCF